ncbi:MAG: PilZ domain-containing protein [Phycisphaerae bacterium]|jgi:hypothetical protein
MIEPMKQNQNVSFVERRTYARVPFTHKLMVLDMNTGHKFEGNGIDISVMGIGFYSRKLFQKEHHVQIQVWLDGGENVDPVLISGTVKWSKPEQDGGIMGVQFDMLIKASDHPDLYEQICKKEV